MSGQPVVLIEASGGVTQDIRVFRGDTTTIHIDWDETDPDRTDDAQAALEYVEDKIDEILPSVEEGVDGLRRTLAELEELRTEIPEDYPDVDVTPRCDICRHRQDDPPHGFADADWNGETGNHETCEQRAAAS